MRLVRWFALAALPLSIMGCQPPNRDIRVVWRGNGLVIDFPWSLWRLIGWQDRTYCVDSVELYDSRAVLWALKIASDRQCIGVQMPIRIGSTRSGFESRGTPRLKPGVRYGIAVDGIGTGRVDFEVRPGRQATLLNETDWKELIEHPEDRAWREHVMALEKLGLSEEELYHRIQADLKEVNRATQTRDRAAAPSASADKTATKP